MLELENFGVVEMSSQEQIEVEGGIWGLLLFGIGFLIGYELINLIFP